MPPDVTLLLVSPPRHTGPASDIFVTPALAIQVLTLLPIAFECSVGGKELPEISEWRMIDADDEPNPSDAEAENHLPDAEKDTIVLDLALKHSIDESTKNVDAESNAHALSQEAKDAMQDTEW